MAKEQNDTSEERPSRPPTNGAGLIEWRLQQLELHNTQQDLELKQRTKSIDEDVEKLKGIIAATLHRIDNNFAKLIIWATLVAGVVGFIIERYFEWARK